MPIEPHTPHEQRREYGQTYPRGIGVEIVGQTRAYAAQLAVLHVAVETPRNAGIAVVVGGLGMAGLFAVFLVDLRRRSQLLDYVVDQRSAYDRFRTLRREYQFGYARLDVGYDLLAVGIVLVGLFQRLDVGAQHVVGVAFKRERDPCDAAFLYFVHGSCLITVVVYTIICGCCRRSNSSMPS